jgi:NhaA family Na+:H+ antiporter
LQEFLSTSTASAIVLFGAVVAALVWANVGDSYDTFWRTSLLVRVGDRTIGGDLHFWVNDGLMTIFFLLVGIEIKRELTTGELRDRRAAAVPAIAAIGGMAVPAVLFLLVAGGGEVQRGWGVPMATDIAIALGALALAARHAPSGLKPLLLTLAIVDDIGAIVVIAVFYSDAFDTTALAVAAALLGALVAVQRVHIRSTVVYAVLGVGVWYCTWLAGISPTIAGVALGLLTPAVPFQRPAAVSAEAKRTADETVDDPEPPDADAHWWLRLAALARESVSPLARVEHVLLPWSSFIIVPLFALANAGVRLGGPAVGDAVTGRLGLAIIVGLVLGKPLGVLAAARASTAAGVGVLPADVGWGDILGMGATAGIGFTVALFIAQLAFPTQPDLLAQAKVAILVGSVLAGAVGNVTLRAFRSPPSPSGR